MGKDSLVGQTLWGSYSKKVSDRMDNPKNRGDLTEEDAKKVDGKLVIADFGAESCGDAVRLYWIVNKNDVIVEAKFRSFGCGTAIASSDMMAELCINKTVDQAVKITNIDVEAALRDDPDTPAVPPQKMHCSVMAYDVIKKAASIHKGVSMDSFEDEVIVCECARVSLATIRNAIKINDLKTVEEVTNYTKAGGYCKSCVEPGGHEDREYYIVDILKEVRAEMEEQEKLQEREKKADEIDQKMSNKKFKDLTVVQKLKRLEDALDETVRPSLALDGGNLEVVDIKEVDDVNEIYIRYLGGCAGCPSGLTGTLYGIENALKAELEEEVRIIPV